MKLASWTALALVFAIGQAGRAACRGSRPARPGRPPPLPGPRSKIEADQTVDLHKLDAIEPLVQAAIAEKKLPGAVVLIGRGDRILYQKAIGSRALVPAVEADVARHDLRSRVAHEGRRDDDQRDDAGRARQAAA